MDIGVIYMPVEFTCRCNLHALSISSELEPHHQMPFSVILRTPLVFLRSLTLYRRKSQCILNPTNRINDDDKLYEKKRYMIYDKKEIIRHCITQR